MLSVRTSRKLDGIETCAHKGTHKVKNLFSIATHCKDLWIQAYSNIHSNKGSMTKGISGTTIDGFSMERVDDLINQLRTGTYHPKPSRRVFIPKGKGKLRPLGIPNAEDKLVQEVWRILLETIYEPVFVPRSHGFRPQRSCHTALHEIKRTWRGTKWFVEFDIKGYFDNIDQNILITLLEKRIEDKRFVKVIKLMLKAGYIQDWKYHKTFSGTPQGGIISPVLANVYLHELDEFVSSISFNKGRFRARRKAYHNLGTRKLRIKRKIEQFKEKDELAKVQELLQTYKELTQQQTRMTFGEAQDPNYKRLRYLRYADDFLLGIIGSRQEALTIKKMITTFVEQQLNLEVSKEKTNIKHSKEGVIFLGYHIHVFSKNNVRRQVRNGIHCKMRNTTDVLALNVPKEKMEQFCLKKDYGNLNEPRIGKKIKHRPGLIRLSDVEIVLTYNAELRGLANYYSLAYGMKQALSHVVYVATYSLYKTLANKHKTTIGKIIEWLNQGGYQAIKFEVKGKKKEYKIFQLKNFEPRLILSNQIDSLPNSLRYASTTEIVKRLRANVCEYCGKTEGMMEVHHIKRLKDVRQGKAYWQILMTARKRKTLVLCRQCHVQLHNGTLPDLRHVKTK